MATGVGSVRAMGRPMQRSVMPPTATIRREHSERDMTTRREHAERETWTIRVDSGEGRR